MDALPTAVEPDGAGVRAPDGEPDCRDREPGRGARRVGPAADQHPRALAERHRRAAALERPVHGGPDRAGLRGPPAGLPALHAGGRRRRRPPATRSSRPRRRCGRRSVPAAAERNIYTALPDGTMVAFDAAHAAQLSAVPADDGRGGASSTSCARSRLAPSSTRRPPCSTRRRSTRRRTWTTRRSPPQLADRRTLLFVGANDGMLHAIDGRTGVEVWAFIPFNLLPKLRALHVRAGRRLVQLLRRQLREDRRREDRRRLEDAARHRGRPGRHLLPDARRDARRACRAAVPSNQDGGGGPARATSRTAPRIPPAVELPVVRVVRRVVWARTATSGTAPAPSRRRSARPGPTPRSARSRARTGEFAVIVGSGFLPVLAPAERQPRRDRRRDDALPARRGHRRRCSTRSRSAATAWRRRSTTARSPATAAG